jgi:hypothetical protein
VTFEPLDDSLFDLRRREGFVEVEPGRFRAPFRSHLGVSLQHFDRAFDFQGFVR